MSDGWRTSRFVRAVKELSEAFDECKQQWDAEALAIVIRSGLAGHIGGIVGLMEWVEKEHTEES